MNTFFKALDNLDFVQNIRNNNVIEIIKEPSLTEDQFNKSFPEDDFLHLSETNFFIFIKDLKDELGLIEDEETRKEVFEKAKKDLGKLTKVTKVDKNGKKITVYIAQKQAPVAKDGKAVAPEHKEFNVNGMFLTALSSGKMTEAGLKEVAKHYDSLSHINRIRFEKEWLKQTGKEFFAHTTYGEETKKKEQPKTEKKEPIKSNEQIDKERVDKGKEQMLKQVEARKKAQENKKVNNNKDSLGEVVTMKVDDSWKSGKGKKVIHEVDKVKNLYRVSHYDSKGNHRGFSLMDEKKVQSDKKKNNSNIS